MPAMEKHAECDAQADYEKFQAFQQQSSNNGLIWLDFASQIVLVVIGALLVVCICCLKSSKNMIVNPLICYGFIFLLIVSLIMEIVVFSVFYPGRFLNPNSGFGLTSVIIFPFKYILLGYMCQWLWISGSDSKESYDADVSVDDSPEYTPEPSIHGSEFKKSFQGIKADVSVSRPGTIIQRRDLSHPDDTYGVQVNLGSFLNENPNPRSPLIETQENYDNGGKHEYPFERERRLSKNTGYRYSDRR